MSDLHVVGGTYREFCAEPRRDDLLGSGLRAAACLGKLSRTTLHTYCDAKTAELVRVNASTYRVKIKSYPAKVVPSFAYSHSLATPSIRPPHGSIPQSVPIELDEKRVLCFGMLEGASIVSGDRVVYDPQSAFAPERFSKHGSKATHLAVVLNESELQKLVPVAQQKPKSILSRLEAEVVVLKRGARGATVFDGKGVTHVPAFKTNHVRKIGSGDVFAAVFAHFWAVKRKSPSVAAWLASKGAAYYCNSSSLPLPGDFDTIVDAEFRPLKTGGRKAKVRPLAYLAGPFFTMSERWLINETRRMLLDQGLRVFSPMHDVGIGPAEVVAPADLRALRKSDVVFAVLDGLDAGTLFEVGHAIADGIPVVGLAQNVHEDDLKMLQGSGCRIVDEFSSAIYHAAWAAFGA